MRQIFNLPKLLTNCCWEPVSLYAFPSQKGLDMSVSSIGPSSAAAQIIATAQAKGPDMPNDGDGDAGDAPKVQSAPPPGMGQLVDKTA